MHKLYAISTALALIACASCEDYASIRQELTNQTKLLQATAISVKHAESSQSVIAALRQFNDEMEKLHDCLAENRKRSSELKSLISSPYAVG